MHETAQAIVGLFRKTGNELATSQIIEQIDKEYAELRQNLGSIRDDKEINDVKRKISQLHRKTLHHLNKLVKLGILKIVKHGEKGEKFFTLGISDGEEIIEISPEYKRRIIVSKPTNVSMPIEGYEQKGIVTKYEPATWIDRLNSIIVLCEKSKNLDFFHKLLTENVFPIVNDSIDLENFEILINKESVVEFIKNIDGECEDYGKIVNLSINISEITNFANFNLLLDQIEKNSFKNLRFIFALSQEDFTSAFNLLFKIIEVFSKARKELYVKNRRVQKSPYFIGRSGPYSMNDKEWSSSEDLKKNLFCIACSQSAAIVDVNKFYNENGLDIEKFSQLMFNISKSMLTANSLQRRKSEDYFKSVNILNKGNEADFLILSRNYIRFWNFGLSQPEINQEFVLNMINEAKKKIDHFAVAEETIYKSCGMTTRFRLALAPSFRFSGGLSEAKYNHLEIRDVEDLSKKDIRKSLIEREALSQLFDGGNEVTLHYMGLFDVDSMLRHLNNLLSNYKIPLYNLNFSQIKGDLKLSAFI